MAVALTLHGRATGELVVALDLIFHAVAVAGNSAGRGVRGIGAVFAAGFKGIAGQRG